MKRTSLALLAVWLATASASAQLRHVDSYRSTGSSAAVIVADSAALLHTRQTHATALTIAQGLSENLAALESSALLTLLKEKRLPNVSPREALEARNQFKLVKLNFVVPSDDVVPLLERALAVRFEGRDGPAVSFVTGRLPNRNARFAMDAVYTLPAAAAPKQVEIWKDGSAVLPAGTRIWISGQAEKGMDLAEATRKTMASLRDSLKFLGLNENSIVQLKAFLHPMFWADDAVKEMTSFFGAGPVPPIVLVEWHSSLPIEIELIAWGGRERAGEPLEFLTPPGMKASPVFSRIARINYGKLIYTSGLHASKADNPAAEITEVFDTLGGILTKAGSDYRHLAKATYYCTTAETVKKMGELRPRYYDPKRPPAASLAMTEGVGRAGNTMTLDMIAVPSPSLDTNEYGPPEYGHGLTEKDALDGWISLFDGKTTFGWKDGNIEAGLLVAGKAASKLPPDWEAKIDIARKGRIRIGAATTDIAVTGVTKLEASGDVSSSSIELLEGIAVRSLVCRARRLPQLYNRCHDGDVAKPWTWATGAIDDRQNARRLVSRDGAWFVQTVIAQGPHLATWVNGYQTVAWTDTRPKHENARQGLRLEPGVIQLQAHDAGTNIEFRKIAARAFH